MTKVTYSINGVSVNTMAEAKAVQNRTGGKIVTHYSPITEQLSEVEKLRRDKRRAVYNMI